MCRAIRPIDAVLLQLKPGVHAPTTPVDNLWSNWADMVLAGLAWSLKAWAALLVPESPQPAREHRAEKQRLLRMEFRTFCAALIEMPCQIVRDGRRLIYRLLPWNPWNGMFLRLVERLRPPLLATSATPRRDGYDRTAASGGVFFPGRGGSAWIIAHWGWMPAREYTAFLQIGHVGLVEIGICMCLYL